MKETQRQKEKEIREAYTFLREKNMSVPSETLQFMLDASLEKLQSQLTVPNVSECGANKIHKALEWWQDLIENDLCDDMEKKHGFYGHDIGSTQEDIVKMYEMECNSK